MISLFSCNESVDGYQIPPCQSVDYIVRKIGEAEVIYFAGCPREILFPNPGIYNPNTRLLINYGPNGKISDIENILETGPFSPGGATKRVIVFYKFMYDQDLKLTGVQTNSQYQGINGIRFSQTNTGVLQSLDLGPYHDFVFDSLGNALSYKHDDFPGISFLFEYHPNVNSPISGWSLELRLFLFYYQFFYQESSWNNPYSPGLELRNINLNKNLGRNQVKAYSYSDTLVKKHFYFIQADTFCNWQVSFERAIFKVKDLYGEYPKFIQAEYSRIQRYINEDSTISTYAISDTLDYTYRYY